MQYENELINYLKASIKVQLVCINIEKKNIIKYNIFWIINQIRKSNIKQENKSISGHFVDSGSNCKLFLW